MNINKGGHTYGLLSCIIFRFYRLQILRNIRKVYTKCLNNAKMCALLVTFRKLCQALTCFVIPKCQGAVINLIPMADLSNGYRKQSLRITRSLKLFCPLKF